MKLVLLAVGKLKEPWVRAGCDEYKKRLVRQFPVEEQELRSDAQLEQQLARPGRARVVALDERGRQVTSRELAERLAAWQREGVSEVRILVGGADGLPAGLRVDETLALSRLTLPHRIARLLLFEQLYRAASINRGEPYHRD